MRRLAAYFILAIALTWLIALPLYAPAIGLGQLPTLPYHHFFAALGPILAALIVTAVSEGKEGMGELVGRLLKWRVDPLWYVAALFGPFALFLAAASIQGLTTGEWLDMSAYGRSAEFPALGLFGVWAVHTLTFGLGEEVGWRGYALPRLQSVHSALVATLILTAFWALWHLPLFAYRPGYMSMSMGGAFGWLLSLLIGSILLTWLYNSTRGSILIPILFHGSIDVAFTTEAAQGWVVNLMGALLVLCALAVLIAFGPKNLADVPKHVL